MRHTHIHHTSVTCHADVIRHTNMYHMYMIHHTLRHTHYSNANQARIETGVSKVNLEFKEVNVEKYSEKLVHSVVMHIYTRAHFFHTGGEKGQKRLCSEISLLKKKKQLSHFGPFLKPKYNFPPRQLEGLWVPLHIHAFNWVCRCCRKMARFYLILIRYIERH